MPARGCHGREALAPGLDAALRFLFLGNRAVPVLACAMSGFKTKRGSSGAIIPTVSIETWKSLLAAADDFQRLAPWRWMDDSQVIGLRHPQTGEVLLCTILGKLKELFALQVYRREAGHRWLLQVMASDPNDDAWWSLEEKGFEVDALQVEFTTRGDLWKEDRALLAAARYTPIRNKGRVWPQFRSLRLGCYPWPIDQEETEILLFALPRVAAVARLENESAIWGVRLPGEIPFVPEAFDPARDALKPWALEWHPMLAPPEPPPTPVTLDEAQLARLKTLPQAAGFCLELDLFHMPTAVNGPERPWFPVAALAVERASGFVVSFRFTKEPLAETTPTLAATLVEALTLLKHRPEKICVQRPRLARMLQTVGTQLGVPIQEQAELEALNEARSGMEKFFMR